MRNTGARELPIFLNMSADTVAAQPGEKGSMRERYGSDSCKKTGEKREAGHGRAAARPDAVAIRRALW